MAIPHGVISKAWADKKEDIEKTFTIAPDNDHPASHAPQLPDYRANIPDIGLCSGGSSGGTARKSKGDSTLSVRDLFIWSLKEPKQKDPIFSQDGATVLLPIGFSLLEVKGSFEVSTVCGYYSFWGSELYSQPTSVHGYLFESFTSCSLDFKLGIAGSRLTYNGVSIPGTPSMHSQVDDGLPDWLQKFAGVMSGHDINESIHRSMVNVFATAAFTGRMVETLNKAIGV